MRPGTIGTIVACALIAGCASYNQLLVNADGSVVSCDAAGGGLIGMAYASHVSTNCIASRRAAGFIEVEQAGAVGFATNASAVVIRLAPGGPAQLAGLQTGDRILAANGVAVTSDKELWPIIFGKVGDTVRLRVQRAGAEQELAMVAKSWSEVNGIKKAPAAPTAAKLSAEDMRH